MKTSATSSRDTHQRLSSSEEYEDWARNAGIIFPKISQSYFGELRGCKALDLITPDETIVTVPRSSALVVDPTIGRCPCPDMVEPDFWKSAPWFVKMAVIVLHEASLGSDSRVSGYIQQLPESIDTPIRWTDEEISELQYPPLEEAIAAQRKLWREQYDNLIESYKKINGKGGSESRKPPSWDRFIWACENVRSRAFSGPYAGSPLMEKIRLAGFVAAAGLMYVLYAHVPLEQALNGAIAAAMFNLLYDIILSNKLKWYALCPIIDSMNHSSKVESRIEFEYFKDTFVASTSKHYNKGDQVYISYGAQGNDGLFQYYGFIEAENPYETYVLKDARLKFARDAATSTIAADLRFDGRGKLIPECKKEIRASMGGAAKGSADDRQTKEKDVNVAIALAIREAIDGFPTTIQEDEKALKSRHLLSSRACSALEYRIAKKKILLKAAQKLEKAVTKATKEAL